MVVKDNRKENRNVSIPFSIIFIVLAFNCLGVKGKLPYYKNVLSK